MSVELRGVFARDQAGLKGAARGQLAGLSLSLGPGITAVLGAPEDGTLALFDVASGKQRPARGLVRVGSGDPYRDPGLRRRIGALGLEPALPLSRDVAATVALATSAWSTPKPAADVLAPLGLQSLAARSVASLGRGELRAVELALALATPSPALLVLLEPLTDVDGPSRADVLARVEEVAKDAPVLVISSYPGDARAFARVAVLHRGLVARGSEGDHGDLGGRGFAQLAVWVGAGLRPFAAALSAHEAVGSLVLETAAEPEGLGVVRVSGRHKSALALAIAEVVADTGCDVRGMAEVTPTLPEVRAASEWELRAQALAAEVARTAEHAARVQLAAMTQAQRPWPPPGGPPS